MVDAAEDGSLEEVVGGAMGFSNVDAAEVEAVTPEMVVGTGGVIEAVGVEVAPKDAT